MINISRNTDSQLLVVNDQHPLWSDVIQQVHTRYKNAFNADLNLFMPQFFVLVEGDKIKSLCGFRVAKKEALFLEQYLDDKAEYLLSKEYNERIPRESLIEFGQLASFVKGLSPYHFYLMTQYLVRMGYKWCIFTATDLLYVMIKRLGLKPSVLSEADASRIENAKTIWGTYYDRKPRIIAGNLVESLTVLERRMEQVTQRYQQNTG
ncbi:thermostable hemolysin [Vibrio sp.]|nr:thermostable hemolysin [Vibrio sp.]